MTDHFETRERFGWGNTIKNRAGGALIGLILFGAAFPLLWWNEGRLAQNSLILRQIAQDVTSFDVTTSRVPEGAKPVFVSAMAETDKALSDQDFGITVPNALRLWRRAEMYQWQEEKNEKTYDRAGGSSERVISYDYKKVWAAGQIDSSRFHKSDSYRNPGNPVNEQKWHANNVRLGLHQLDPVWLNKLRNFIVLPPPAGWKPPPPYQASGDWYYVASDPQNPTIGDIRVRFEYIPAGQLSLIGTVRQNRIEPVAPNMLMIAEGSINSDSLIAQRKHEEQAMSWVIRLAGFIMMALGIQGVFVLLGALGGIIPGFRALAGFFGGIVGVLIALALGTITIALAWFAARPLLTLALAGGALLFLLLAWHLRKSRKTSKKKMAFIGAVQRAE